MERKRISTGSMWESVAGYSRAVRVGAMITVAGTTAVDAEGVVIGEGDVYEQTRFILRKIERALLEVGSGLNDVVRTRMFVTNIADWESVGRAHGEIFAEIRPAATMVEVNRLIDPKLLIEIEVDAIADD